MYIQEPLTSSFKINEPLCESHRGSSNGIQLHTSTTFYLVRHTYNPGGTHSCNGWVSDWKCTSCGASASFPSTAETGYGCGNQIPNGDITESYWTTDPNAANIVSSYTLSI